MGWILLYPHYTFVGRMRRGYSERGLMIVVVVVHSLSRVRLFVTPWTAARPASLSFTVSRSLLKLVFIESMMPPNHLTLCRPLLLPPSIFPSIRVFPSESALRIRWPKYWSCSFSPSNEYSGLAYFALKSTLYTTHVTTQIFENFDSKHLLPK